MKIKLNDQVMSNLKVAKEFEHHTKPITGIDFFPDGKRLISCSLDDTIAIYDCEQGTHLRTVYSKKYGVDLIKFGTVVDKVVYASTKVNDTIRYLSLPNNKFIRYFDGHTGKVVSICSHPSREKIISCSLDGTMKLWDIRTVNSEGIINLTGPSIASFDPQGVIFVLGVNSEVIKLYDLRSFRSGPFLTFNNIPKTPNVWTELKFSEDGKTILINSSGFIQLIDSFSGAFKRTLSGHVCTNGVYTEASYTPDSKYVISGSINGRMHIWNAETGRNVCVMNPKQSGAIQYLQFNPKLFMSASTCKNKMLLWLPDDRNEEGGSQN